MPTIHFTSALKRFFPSLKSTTVQARNLAAVFAELEKNFPGFTAYILDERGALRRHVNIFIGEKMTVDKESLSDLLADADEVYILQSLSGG